MMTNMAALNMIQKSEKKDMYLNMMVGFFSIGEAAGPFLVATLQ